MENRELSGLSRGPEHRWGPLIFKAVIRVAELSAYCVTVHMSANSALHLAPIFPAVFTHSTERRNISGPSLTSDGFCCESVCDLI